MPAWKNLKTPAGAIFMQGFTVPNVPRSSLNLRHPAQLGQGASFVSGETRNGTFPSQSWCYLFAAKVLLKDIPLAMICRQGILKAKIHYIFPRLNHTMGQQRLAHVFTFRLHLLPPIPKFKLKYSGAMI